MEFDVTPGAYADDEAAVAAPGGIAASVATSTAPVTTVPTTARHRHLARMPYPHSSTDGTRTTELNWVSHTTRIGSPPLEDPSQGTVDQPCMAMWSVRTRSVMRTSPSLRMG